MFYFDLNALLLIVINIFVFTLFCLLFYFIYKSYRIELAQEEKALEDNAYKKALELLQKAHNQSVKVLSESNKKAQKIIKSAKLLSDEYKNDIEKRLDEVTANQITEINKLSEELYKKYTFILDQSSNESLKKLEAVTNNIEQEAVKGVDELTQALKEETLGSQKKLDEKVTAEYEQIKIELERYKADQMKKIDFQIQQIVYRVIKDVIGNKFDLEDQRDLVLKSLEQAKTEGVFTQ